uniref:Uncharacterized protein n=1 Tax=Oryza glumipatula TaxID=40148 RepID=A0A0D9Y800_9ORYZ
MYTSLCVSNVQLAAILLCFRSLAKGAFTLLAGQILETEPNNFKPWTEIKPCVTISFILGLIDQNSGIEGAEQFRLDVAANPNDTEESIWCFLCEAQLYGVGLDSRSVMRKAYALFKDGGDAEKKDAELAKSHIVAACRSGDYMASLALVHCECRNWTLE